MTHRVKKHRREPSPDDPVGVFDSGVGGLSVLRHLRRLMPAERFVFLADQSYVPYGAKTGRQLIARTSAVSRFLRAHRAKAVVVACNTATCYAIDALRSRFAMPFIGTVPAVKPAAALSRNGVVAVLSTPATARSAALRLLIRRFAAGRRVVRIGCAGLEEAVERGALDGPGTGALLKRFCGEATRSGADVVVLGCTHYPFLKRRIARMTGARTVDSGAAVARRTRAVLSERGTGRRAGPGSASFWTTGDPREFSRVASLLLGERVRARKARI
jgi:glutamate racemase